VGRKDECNRNIRDLGVLPEEAFEKYTNEKLDRVRHVIGSDSFDLLTDKRDISLSRSFIQSMKV
jgi:hypothetical protein